MDSSPIGDPFAQWRTAYNQAEQAWTDFVQKMISTPAYAEATGKSSQALLNSLEAWRGVAERYLTEVWNIPTRNDLGRLGEVIVAIDAKADDLDDRVDGVEATLARLEARLGSVDQRLTTLAIEGPTRVQERSAAVDERIGGLERRLDEVLAKLDQVAKQIEAAPPRSGNGSGRAGSGGPSRGSGSRPAPEST